MVSGDRGAVAPRGRYEERRSPQMRSGAIFYGGAKRSEEANEEVENARRRRRRRDAPRSLPSRVIAGEMGDYSLPRSAVGLSRRRVGRESRRAVYSTSSSFFRGDSIIFSFRRISSFAASRGGPTPPLDLRQDNFGRERRVAASNKCNLKSRFARRIRCVSHRVEALIEDSLAKRIGNTGASTRARSLPSRRAACALLSPALARLRGRVVFFSCTLCGIKAVT